MSPASGDSAEYEMGLFREHRELLRASAISIDVARERGYESAETKVRLEAAGFGRAQRIVPALLIPLYGVHGDIVGYQLRPNHPRIGKNGKPVKYETPSGQRMVLDCHPRVRAHLGDPARPLLITEGIRKADAAITAGLDCIALLGVWNWRGTNSQGGKTALADWEAVALNGRRVLIAFDSDAMTNGSVYDALVRLKSFLESKGADVQLIYLPSGEAGAKVGLDDYLAAGHSVDELFSLASSELRHPPRDPDADRRYRLTSSGMVWQKPTAEGTVDVVLTNFNARVVTDILHDDGAEQRRELELELWRGDEDAPRITHRIPADRLGAVDRWAIETLGIGAIVNPGPMMRDHARTAVQECSGDAMKRTIYAHTGWRRIDGLGDVYLHAGGAIGAGGAVEGIDVELAPPLDRYVLPEPPDGDALLSAIAASLRLIDLASDTITVPVLASVYRTPLGIPIDFCLHLAGSTGVGKTEIAALAQQHSGAGMDARNLPGSWSSTGNALEILAFVAKDALLVVDDFAPTGTTYDVARQHRDADRLLRAQGNRSGRQRLRADTSSRPVKPPRGFVVSTGEDVPTGQSLRARMFVVEVAPDALDWNALTAAQADAADGLLAAAMSAYVRWIAEHRDMVAAIRRQTVEEIRAEVRAAHPRTAGIVGELLAGFDVFLEFARDAGVLDAREAEALRERALRALVGAADMQQAHQRDAEPTQRFLGLLASALASGRAHLSSIHGSAPSDHVACGWRSRPIRDDEELVPQGARVGWIDNDDLYLDAAAAYRAAREMANGSDGLAVTERTLYKRLHERGLLVSTDENRQTLKVRRIIEGRRQAVLHLHAAALGLSHDNDEPDQPDHEAQASTSTRRSEARSEGGVPLTTPHHTEGEGQKGLVARFVVGLVGSPEGEMAHGRPSEDAVSPRAETSVPKFELQPAQLHLDPDQDTEEQGRWTW